MRIEISSPPILPRRTPSPISKARLTTWLPLLLLPWIALNACYTPPLTPAPPDTGPETEALELFQGLYSPISDPVDALGAQEGLRLMQRLEHYGVPGVSIAVIDGGELRWAKAWGMASGDLENGQSMTPETPLQAASISKLLTATAILRQLDASALSLDHLDDPSLLDAEAERLGFEDVTLRHLLSHTSGLDTPAYLGYEPGEALPSLEQILLGEDPASHGPVRQAIPAGQQWRYSGGAYQVLESWLERSSGSDFASLVQKEIFDPLEMKSSSFQPAADTAVGHDRQGEALPRGHRVYPERAAAGLWTTPADLAAWVIDMQKAQAGKPRRRVDREQALAMLTPQEPGGWGLGPQLGGKGHATYFAHLGGNPGYRAAVIGFKASGHGAVIMTNGENGTPLIREILAGLAKIYNWPAFHAQTRDSQNLDPEAWSSLAGSYALDSLPGIELRLSLAQQAPDSSLQADSSSDGSSSDGSRSDRAGLLIEVFGERSRLLASGADEFFDHLHGFEIKVLQRGVEGEAQKLEFTSFPSFRFIAERQPAQAQDGGPAPSS